MESSRSIGWYTISSELSRAGARYAQDSQLDWSEKEEGMSRLILLVGALAVMARVLRTPVGQDSSEEALRREHFVLQAALRQEFVDNLAFAGRGELYNQSLLRSERRFDYTARVKDYVVLSICKGLDPHFVRALILPLTLEELGIELTERHGRPWAVDVSSAAA